MSVALRDLTTLEAIKIKVRRLAGRPSANKITDLQLTEYINTFYLYDMPQIIRIAAQEKTFSFITIANQATYPISEIKTAIPDETALNIYINFKPPVYIAGRRSRWFQDRENFFVNWPPIAQIESSLEGNGTNGPYNLTFAASPILQNQVTVGAIGAITGTEEAIYNVIDEPINRTVGGFVNIDDRMPSAGTINYLTGACSVTFPGIIPRGNQITFTGVPYQPSLPLSVLFYDNTLTLRPVPDKAYLIRLNAFVRPSLLTRDGASPALQQWAEFIAYGAAKKIFEDTQDTFGLESIMAEYKHQEVLVLRRSIVNQATQRVTTIYSPSLNINEGDNFFDRF